MSKFNVNVLFNSVIFWNIFLKAKSVVCARSSPKIKAMLTKLIKKSWHCVLAIGDGENDVGMICESDVGIGIFGKEGT